MGLIAPFEGLYRESGYAALAAMRQAMADCTPPGLEVIPVALDSSGDPAQTQRAAQKLLVDPTVRAIIGPLLLETVPAATTVMTQATDMPWFVPSLVAPAGGFAAPQASSWLEVQVDYLATITAADRVLLLGLPAEWALQINVTVPVLHIDDLDRALAAVKAGDAILWLGRPDVGSRWLSALRMQQPDVDFWLGAQGGLSVFTAHTTSDLHATRWLVWTDLNYNEWLQSAAPTTHPNGTADYLTYRATCVALNSLIDGPTATTAAWQLQSQPVERPEADEE